MPTLLDNPAESSMNLRLSAALKADFAAAAGERPVAEVLRELMRRYVDEVRQRRFREEARRQSQLLAHSTDEAEVQLWMRDVSLPQDSQ